MPEYKEGVLDVISSIPHAWSDLKSIKDDITSGHFKDVLVGGDRAFGNVAPALGEVDKLINPNNTGKSIIARAKNSIIQFPVYITKGIRVTEAQIISKLFERVYTSMVQVGLAQNPIINEDEVNNLMFLRRLHSNINEPEPDGVVKSFESSIPIDDIDQMIKESVVRTMELGNNLVLEFRIPSSKSAEVDYLLKEHARLNNEPLQGFKYLQEANVYTHRKEWTEKDRPERTLGSSELEVIAKQNGYADTSDKTAGQNMLDQIRYNNEIVNVDGRRIEVRMGTEKRTMVDPNNPARTIVQEVPVPEAFLAQKHGTKYSRSENPLRDPVNAPVLLRDGDIKKINAMAPYMIQASFRIRQANGELSEDVTFLIGVKTILHLVDVNDISEDIRDIINGRDRKLQKVRYKTGEINFMDYMFNLSQAKKDVRRFLDRDKRWINTLKRLSEYRDMYGLTKSVGTSLSQIGDNPIPNGTLVVSQTDVIKITNETGIDIGEVATAKKLARSLFLIGVVILDIVAGNMKVLLVDDYNDWDIQSIAAIDAEVSKTDNSQLMRELNRLVNR